MNPIKWHIGCSGFHYKEWKEEFYPKGLAQKNWFAYYTQHFNTLELNVTFYRFPTLKSLEGWHEKAPEGFTFSAKVPKSITHFKRLRDTDRMVDDFYGLLREGLKDKLGCVLLQLPPQFSYDEERLQLVIQATRPGFQNVVEFRHESWWREDVQRLLAENKITVSGVSFPKISNENAIVNRDLVYYRFHGVPKLFYSEYTEEFVRSIASQVTEHPLTREAYIYFNNTASTAALHNARQMLSAVKNL